jgi:hypothetical protein
MAAAARYLSKSARRPSIDLRRAHTIGTTDRITPSRIMRLRCRPKNLISAVSTGRTGTRREPGRGFSRITSSASRSLRPTPNRTPPAGK